MSWWRRSRKQEVEIVIANVTELKPDARYLIGLDSRAVSTDTADKLATRLDELGFANFVIMLSKGDPNETIKIIEQKEQ